MYATRQVKITNEICTSNHMMMEIRDKFPEITFEILEISRMKRGKLKNCKKRTREIHPEFHEAKHVITG